MAGELTGLRRRRLNRFALAAAVGALTLAAALAVEGTRLLSSTPGSVLDVCSIVAFAVAGFLFCTTDDQRNAGLLLLLVAFLEELKRIAYYGVGPLPWLGWTVGTLSEVVTGLVLLRYPNRRLPRASPERLWVVAAFCWFFFTRATVALPSSRQGFWPALHESSQVRVGASVLANTGRLVFGAVFVLLLVRRLRRERGTARREIAPLMIAGIVGTVATMVHTVVVLQGNRDAPRWILVIEAVALLGVPAMLLVASILHQLARIAGSDLVVQLGTRPSPREVESALAGTLRDPDLRLLLWDQARDSWVDVDGHTAPRSSHEATLTAVPVDTAEGSPLAVVFVDPGVARNQRLIEVMRNASRFALENGQLQQTLRSHLAAVQSLHARIATAAQDERLRMQRDLHDGFQQRLFALAATIGRVRLSAPDEATLALAVEAGGELRTAQAELRDLVRGNAPAALANGLGPAVQALGGRLPISVATRVEVFDLPPQVEATAYFVVCEALTNALKYADATRVEVVITQVDAGVLVEVCDDGCGGAEPGVGSGLAGLAGRVDDVGGRLDVISPVGLGTRITADLPVDGQPGKHR